VNLLRKEIFKENLLVYEEHIHAHTHARTHAHPPYNIPKLY